METIGRQVNLTPEVAPPSPLDRGWYVDGLVTAVQRFENSSRALSLRLKLA